MIESILNMSLDNVVTERLRLEQNDCLIVAVVRNGKQVDFLRLCHRSVNDDGSDEEIKPITVRIDVSQEHLRNCGFRFGQLPIFSETLTSDAQAAQNSARLAG